MKDLMDMTLEELWTLFPIVLKEHNSDYAAWYNEEKERLLHIILDVYRISHIGSTAVGGLIAKPIVDILLELPAGYNMEATTQLLIDNGWIFMQQDSAQETLDMNKGYTPHGFAEKVFHLHVKPAGDWGELYFRYYLQQHPEISRQYEALKKSLLKRFAHNRDAYTNAKTEFVMEYTQKARAEYPGRYFPY